MEQCIEKSIESSYPSAGLLLRVLLLGRPDPARGGDEAAAEEPSDGAHRGRGPGRGRAGLQPPALPQPHQARLRILAPRLVLQVSSALISCGVDDGLGF